MEDKILWKDKKRPIFGLPISFTTYTLTQEKLLCDFGILNRTQEEIWLYRIVDVTLKRSFFQRIFNVGTVHVCSGDRSNPEFDIISVKDPLKVKDLLSSKVDEERTNRKVNANEFLDM